jgi:hypothetical protein
MAENIKLCCNCLLVFTTGFILDLPLVVDSNYIALITNTLGRKLSALVPLALHVVR